MASLVARTAALPSGRACHLGFGRLPPAALPGHGAVVLAGRRDGTGHGGVLAVVLKAPGGRDVKAACDKFGVDPPRMGDEDPDFDDLLGLYIPLSSPLSDEEKAVQEKLKEIVEKCITLIYDAMRRLPHAERRHLDNVFWSAHSTFAVVRSRATDGRTNMVIVEKLYIVLKMMVSCGCSTPLPLDIEAPVMPFTTLVFPFK